MDFFRWLFSSSNPNLPNYDSQLHREIDGCLVGIGKSWAQIQINHTLSSAEIAEAKPWGRILTNGDRIENYYALLKRDIKKQRFLLQYLHDQWRLVLWFGTLKSGFPPDFYDEDGVAFFKHDVETYITIMPSIPGRDSFSKKYYLYVEDAKKRIVDDVPHRGEFNTADELIQALAKMKTRLENTL